MTPFDYARPADVAAAVEMGASKGSRFLGGGTNLVDLMRENVERPAKLVDVTTLDHGIREGDRGQVLIGAAARNTAVAEHPLVRSRYPMLSRAIVSGASAQIRNMATVGGNVLQRTRCTYFYDGAGSRCNKRSPAQGCDALAGLNRYHAILSASPECVATHPSDMCVALVALDAVLHLRSVRGARTTRLEDLHQLRHGHPDVETSLEEGELIAAVELPAMSARARSGYRKVRDRSSYAFALVFVAAAIEVRDGLVYDVRLALGGVAHKPWRARRMEHALLGREATPDRFRKAVGIEMSDAAPLRHNAFKVELVARTVVATLTQLAGVS